MLLPFQKIAAHIDHYARNKTWVAAPIGGKNLERFVSDNIGKAKTSPGEHLEFLKELEDHFFSQFGGISRGGEKSENARITITKVMSTYLGDHTKRCRPRLRSQLSALDPWA
jgi:hypothetical protein